MTRLDDLERRITLWLAVLGGLASVALWAPAFDKSAAIILATVGVGLSALLALTGRSRRRLFTCLAAVLLGFGPWGTAWILGFPYLLLATWLLLRDRKASAERRARGEAEPAPPASPAPREKDPRSPPRASKRYTPPRRG
jgi:hypothetical protein